MAAVIVAVDAEDVFRRVERIRDAGKFGNLSCQYRIGDKTLMTRARVQHGILMDLAQASHTNYVYKRSYPGVPRYWRDAIEKVKQCGYAETFAGRRVQVVGDWERYEWQMGSTAINYVIQGTGGDMKYLALSVMSDYLTDVGGRFLLDLHDGTFFEVPDRHVTEFCVKGKRLLDNLPYTEAWGFTPPIPLNWDCKMGKSWGALKEVKL